MLIPSTDAHCRSTAAIHTAIAAVKSAGDVTVWVVTSAILRDVLKTFAGARTHTRGGMGGNNADRRGGSRRCAAVGGARASQGHDVGPCCGPAPSGASWPPLARLRAVRPSANGSFPALFRWRRTREQPPLWAQFVLSVRILGRSTLPIGVPAMVPTRREVDAARALGEAILNLLVAHEEESAVRARQRSMMETQQRPLSSMLRSNPSRVPTPATASLLVTSKQAAEMLGVSSRTVWGMTAPRGPLQSVRLGSAVRYDVEDLASAIASMKRATNTSIKEEDSR
jgi:predicted DNA-binding transcriptional regulator AlpA